MVNTRPQIAMRRERIPSLAIRSLHGHLQSFIYLLGNIHKPNAKPISFQTAKFICRDLDPRLHLTRHMG